MSPQSQISILVHYIRISPRPSRPASIRAGLGVTLALRYFSDTLPEVWNHKLCVTSFQRAVRKHLMKIDFDALGDVHTLRPHWDEPTKPQRCNPLMDVIQFFLCFDRPRKGARARAGGE